MKYIKEVGSALLRIKSVERNQKLDFGRLDILRPWWLKEAARVTFSQVMSWWVIISCQNIFHFEMKCYLRTDCSVPKDEPGRISISYRHCAGDFLEIWEWNNRWVTLLKKGSIFAPITRIKMPRRFVKLINIQLKSLSLIIILIF